MYFHCWSLFLLNLFSLLVFVFLIKFIFTVGTWFFKIYFLLIILGWSLWTLCDSVRCSNLTDSRYGSGAPYMSGRAAIAMTTWTRGRDENILACGLLKKKSLPRWFHALLISGGSCLGFGLLAFGFSRLSFQFPDLDKGKTFFHIFICLYGRLSRCSIDESRLTKIPALKMHLYDDLVGL